MKTSFRALLALAFLLVLAGCQESMGPAALDQPSELTGANPVIHRVSAGGPDLCESFFGVHPGCDANWSLTAIEKADGTVMGQAVDTFRLPPGNDWGGMHFSVDCLNVAGNEAVIGGVFTKVKFDGVDFSGIRGVVAVVDNGTSANDPPDEISFTIFASGAPFLNPWPRFDITRPDLCHVLTVDDFRTPEDAPISFMYAVSQGQVQVQ